MKPKHDFLLCSPVEEETFWTSFEFGNEIFQPLMQSTFYQLFASQSWLSLDDIIKRPIILQNVFIWTDWLIIIIIIITVFFFIPIPPQYWFNKVVLMMIIIMMLQSSDIIVVVLIFISTFKILLQALCRNLQLLVHFSSSSSSTTSSSWVGCSTNLICVSVKHK